MQSSLALTALLMGLAGGPHCVAMCGAACAGIAQAAGPNRNFSLWVFQLGRIAGYSVLGALAAASLQGLGWLTIQSAALRPVWSLFHVAALVLGLMLLLQARQPVWLEDTARRVWARTRAFAAKRGRGAPIILGMLWALLPCGLLYSALMVAALAGGPAGGAMVMALFAVGTSVTMVVGPWLWLRLSGSQPRLGSGQWGVRLAGAALAASSGWALWMALAHDAAPWCATP
jgi:sulfite exporter TauE/SafE